MAVVSNGDDSSWLSDDWWISKLIGGSAGGAMSSGLASIVLNTICQRWSEQHKWWKVYTRIKLKIFSQAISNHLTVFPPVAPSMC